ncbi:hypothetical protein [Nocardia sp. NPDC056000]|uniref:hypothetical protein n=1 Tax=Nocardia sp. NPDC056000 TaxID=3345674 RepID=UPI0035DC69C3
MSDFDLVRRRELLDEGFPLEVYYRQTPYSPETRAAFNRISDLHQEYRQLLPETVIARCPMTDRIVRWPLDTGGLDGWYWEYNNPVQRRPIGLPATWIALKGAVRVAEPAAIAPFDCRPGPGAPFVSAHLLAPPETRAVLAQIPIGTDISWAITYFAPKRPKDISLEDIWGQCRNPIFDPTSLDREYADQMPSRSADFELLPWLDAGKLLWIAPGDNTATLRTGAADCPYLDLDVDRRAQYIYNGEITRY